jgi:hypothetical protein
MIGRKYIRHEDEKYIHLRKTEGKGPLGRYKHRWEDNINMDLIETRSEVMGWIQDTFQWRVFMNHGNER